MGLMILYMYPCLWVSFTHFDYWNLKFWSKDNTHWCYKKGSVLNYFSYTYNLQLTTTVISKEVCPSFCAWYLFWKLKDSLCQTYYYYILLTYVSCTWASGRRACLAKNQVSLKAVAKNHNSTINIPFICTWSLLFDSHTAFYHFLCAYPVGLNLLVSLIMWYMLSHIAYYCCIRFLNWYGVFYTLDVGNCCCLKFLARRWIGVEYGCLIT